MLNQSDLNCVFLHIFYKKLYLHKAQEIELGETSFQFLETIVNNCKLIVITYISYFPYVISFVK